MKLPLCIAIFLGLLIFSGCGVIRDTPKYSFADGYYRSRVFEKKLSRVYVDNNEDSVIVYKVKGKADFDEVSGQKLAYPQLKSGTAVPANSFRQASFDLDFLTIPFKYRPETDSMPQQFNTTLNGVLYLGYRNDIFRIRYKKTPIKTFTRRTTHYGFSVGLFTGVGGTAMNPWVTNYKIGSEYDGVVWNKGAAAIIGIDNFSIGLTAGFDNLLDKNKQHWIYEGKPWFGLAFGLNLN
jgi:hypothetical protein